MIEPHEYPTIGDDPNSVRALFGHDTIGARRLRERYELPLNFVATPRDYLVNRWGTPAFCWVAGDGNTPTVGPALTATGAPGSIAGPWELADGTRLPLEVHGGATLRASAAPLDPAAGEDAVVVVVGRMPPAGVAGEVLYSTMAGTGQGITLRLAASNQLVAAVRTAGGAEATSTPAAAHVSPSGLFAAVITYDRTADTVTLWTPGATGAAGGVTDGAITGGGIGLGALPGGGSPISSGGAILAAAYYVGAGIAPSWAAAARRTELLSLATGLEPRGNQAPSKGRPAFARASAASWQDDDGRWWIASSGLARAGDPGGWRRAIGRTNRCYNNVNPQAITGWTRSTGGILPTVVDDSVALATAKCECWGPNVIEIDNSGGAVDTYAWNGAAAGNTNSIALSALARCVAGSGARLGLVEPATEAFTDRGALTDGYATRTILNGITPTATQVFAVKVPAGCKLRLIAYQHESNGSATGAVATTPIPNWATGAGAARAADSITPPVSPRDTRGRVSLGYRPMGWSGAVPEGGAQEYFVSRSGGVDYPVYVRANGHYAAYDGTNIADLAAPNPADGVRSAVVAEWSGATQRVTVDGASASSAYDGTRVASGTYYLQGYTAEAAIDSVVIEEAA